MDLTSVKNEYIRNESELGSRYFPKELDFSLSYEYKGLSLAVTDYWFSSDAYFKYKKHNSSHLFEGTVGYDFGFLSLPFGSGCLVLHDSLFFIFSLYTLSIW